MAKFTLNHNIYFSTVCGQGTSGFVAVVLVIIKVEPTEDRNQLVPFLSKAVDSRDPFALHFFFF